MVFVKSTVPHTQLLLFYALERSTILYNLTKKQLSTINLSVFKWNNQQSEN